MRYAKTNENANTNADANTNANKNGNGNGYMRWNRFGIRGSVMAAFVASAALVVTGCGSGESPSASTSPASGSPDSATPTHATSPSPASPSAASASASAPSGSAAAVTPAVDSSRGAAAAAPACSAGSLKVAARQAADRPSGTGTGAAIVEFTNSSAKACVLKGHPTVAGAGNGSPEKNSPLSVTPTGSASPVTLAPKGKAWVKLTFVQVQGEADGFCESGAEPVVYPTLVIGLPGAGKHQVALDDGRFAQCDNKVTVTAVSAVKPT
ncbi:DUF4232 domain-containing protein [Streptomyces zaehneri]|uniref:DUF4232 domain-containing protein n=1 Tax=Streptomyces zaehneri TaxID=3051180 RepID=UPI0028D5B414|nr:DUF4232 domain-containing protein [Streptomyces sp. DSM 40713]